MQYILHWCLSCKVLKQLAVINRCVVVSCPCLLIWHHELSFVVNLPKPLDWNCSEGNRQYTFLRTTITMLPLNCFLELKTNFGFRVRIRDTNLRLGLGWLRLPLRWNLAYSLTQPPNEYNAWSKEILQYDVLSEVGENANTKFASVGARCWNAEP